MKRNDIPQAARDAAGITSILFALGLVGIILDQGAWMLGSGTGLLALAAAFAVIYLPVFAWCIWFNAKHR